MDENSVESTGRKVVDGDGLLPRTARDVVVGFTATRELALPDGPKEANGEARPR